MPAPQDDDPPFRRPRPLGRSDILLSPIAYGMWRFTGADVAAGHALVEAALDTGITLFDTADIYGVGGPGGFGAAEALLGRMLADAPALRDRMVIATRGGIRPGTPYNSSAPYLAEALEASLRRMGWSRSISTRSTGTPPSPIRRRWPAPFAR